MSNPAHDLLLLLLNLTQRKSAERVRATFIDAVGALFAPVRVRWLEEGGEFGGEVIVAATHRKTFGRIAVESPDLSVLAEVRPLLRNAASMLAVILEKFETDRLLADEKLLLQEQVNARTAELRESQEFLQGIADTTPEMIYLYDLKEKKNVYSNREIINFLGYTSEQIKQMGDRIFELTLHPEDAAAVEEHHRKLECSSGEVLELDYRMKDAAGRWRWLCSRDRAHLKAADASVRQIVGVASDITERKHADEVLRVSEENLRQAQRLANTGSWLWELATNMATCSEEMLRIWGYGPEKKALPLEAFTERIHPEDRERVVAALASTLKGGRYDEVFRVIHPETGERIIHGAGEVVLGEDGRTVAMRGSNQDITEVRRGEDALRQSEAKYRGLIENLPQRIFNKDSNSVYISCTANLANDLGIAPDEIIGKTDFDFFPPELAKKYQADDRRIMTSGRTEELEEIYIRDGKERIVQTIKTPLTDETGNAVGILGIFLDITDRRNLERQYQSLFREMLDGFALHEIICDGRGKPVDYRFLSLNPAFERLTGLKARDVLGKTAREVIPGIEPHWIETYGRVALIGDPILFEEYAKDFNKHFEVKAFRPGPNLFACIFADITKRKQAEEEKVRLEEQLHQAQKMEAVGRLAGGVAHDFNNILTGILGFTELIQATVGPGDPIHGDLEEIRNASDRAAALTAQLLAFSRKQIINPRVIQPNDVLQNSQRMLHRIIGEDIDFVFKPGGGLWRIKADPGQLDQILVNLAINARDALPDGGKLTIETQNVTLDETYSRSCEGVRPGEFVMLAVTDNGRGMDGEILNHIFEPFFTTKGKERGTGLGLSTVYGIMKQNNGFINVYSEPGVGTTFKIYFPAVMEEAEELISRDMVANPGGTETVLLVEDEEMVRRLAKKILEKYGYKVIEMSNGGLALIWVEKSEDPVDLLLTDVIMPGMNGRELLKRLQVMRPGIKALFMSGYTENVIAHHGVLDQGTEFIQKPFTVGSLTRKVRDALDR